jgi:hypothetical protein
MYTRELQEPRSGPVEKGAPLQGTWTRAFEEVDLLSVQRPYRIPLLKGIKDSRIKEWESFFIQNDRFCLSARLCNLKFYHTATVNMYDRVSGERLHFRKAIPGGSWRLPRNLYNASVESRSLGFFFRIHSWLDAGNIRLDLDIEETRKRPSFTAHAMFDLAPETITPMAVSLLFSSRRNMYAYKAPALVRGDVVYGGRHITLDPAETSGLFCDFKGYYPYRMRSAWCTGLGFDSQNRRFAFTLGENQARESFKNNENALWIDGRLTPLPPVRITRNGGSESDWIIQDMEGMVDLVFTPKEMGREGMNLLFSRFEYENPLGYFNGLVVNSEGEELPVHNVWGTGEKLYLRV